MKQRVIFTKKIDAQTKALAAANEIEAVEEPMIAIRISEASKIAPVLKDVSNAIIVFTSRNAVKAISKSRGFEKPTSLRVYAVGDSTAAAVRDLLQIEPATGGLKNAGGLAQYIIDHELPTKVYFFCGNKRRDELPQLLAHSGFDVSEVVVYETHVTPKKIEDAFDGIAFFSPSAVESFFRLNNLADGVVCYSIGDSTTEELKKYTTSQILTAKEPSEKCLLQLIISKSASKP
jgi:uroporphyrinogen-III synthase